MGALFDALRLAADRAKMGLLLTFLDRDPPETQLLNEHAVRVLGWSQDAIDAQGIWALVPPDEVGRLQEQARSRLAREPVPNLIRTFVLRDGKRVPIEAAISEVKVDDRPAVVALFVDVSERDGAIKALHESEARFRQVVDGAPDGVVILQGPIIQFMNPRAAALLGLPRPEAGVGRSLGEFLPPEDMQRAVERIRTLFETGRPHPTPAQYRVRSPEGGERVVEISSILIELGGKPSVLAFARDVTDRFAIQERLVEAERLSALGVLSAGVAHEINNPLSYVLLNLEYLRRELPRAIGTPERLPELMTRIRDACQGAERVATIVRDLRVFARDDGSERQLIDLRDAVITAINTCSETLQQHAVVRGDYGETPKVAGNRGRLEQIFVNLLLNAAQALPGARPGSDEVRVRVYREETQAVVEIEDTGQGMTPEVKRRAFEPFFTTKPLGVGTGLGLPICRSVVVAHGGTIDIESRPLEGTLVRIKFPGAVAVEEPEPVPSEPFVAHTSKVLIVDDEEIVGTTLRALLDRHFDVRVVTSAEQVLKLLAAGEEFHVVLCDLMMPEMTGVDLYRAIQKDYPQFERRVVFMTGGTRMTQEQSRLEGLAPPVLAKPFDLKLLLQTVRRVVSDS